MQNGVSVHSTGPAMPTFDPVVETAVVLEGAKYGTPRAESSVIKAWTAAISSARRESSSGVKLGTVDGAVAAGAKAASDTDIVAMVTVDVDAKLGKRQGPVAEAASKTSSSCCSRDVGSEGTSGGNIVSTDTAAACTSTADAVTLTLSLTRAGAAAVSAAAAAVEAASAVAVIAASERSGSVAGSR